MGEAYDEFAVPGSRRDLDEFEPAADNEPTQEIDMVIQGRDLREANRLAFSEKVFDFRKEIIAKSDDRFFFIPDLNGNSLLGHT